VSRIGADINARGKSLNETFSTPARTPSEAVALGTKATATAFGGITDVFAEAIKSIPGGKQALDAIGGVASASFKALTDKLSNTKFFQEAAAGLPENNALENSLSATASTGEIASDILAAQGAKFATEKTATGASKAAKVTGDIIDDEGGCHHGRCQVTEDSSPAHSKDCRDRPERHPCAEV
jgi:hypothetical protein